MKLSFLSLAHGTFPDRGIDIEVAPHGLKEIGFIGEVVHGGRGDLLGFLADPLTPRLHLGAILDTSDKGEGIQ